MVELEFKAHGGNRVGALYGWATDYCEISIYNASVNTSYNLKSSYSNYVGAIMGFTRISC